MISPEIFRSSQESPEPKAKSTDLEAAREQYRHQERSAFPEEMALGEESSEYPEPTDTEKGQLDRNIRKLADVFEDSGIRWLLVGSFSVSVIKGGYFRNHKDIDIAIEPSDLESLEQKLFLKGYGLFSSSEHEDSKKRKMTWLSASETRETSEDLQMVAIDKQGKIRETEPLNYIDIHLTKRDEQGRPLGLRGVPLPEKWYESQQVNFKGKSIKLPHPAKEAYFKLHDDRKSSQFELHILVRAGKLTLEDISEIEDIIKKEADFLRSATTSFIERVTPHIVTKSSPKEIFEILISDKEVTDQIKKQEDRKHIYKLAEFIAEQDNKSTDTIKQILMERIGVDAKILEEQKRLQTLHQEIAKSKTINKPKE